MHKVIITVLCLMFTNTAFADIDGKAMEKIFAENDANISACKEALTEDEYVPGELKVGSEYLNIDNDKKIVQVLICGIYKQVPSKRLAAKYVNSVIINKSGLTFGLYRLMQFVDKHQVNGITITHIIISPKSSIKELSEQPEQKEAPPKPDKPFHKKNSHGSAIS